MGGEFELKLGHWVVEGGVDTRHWQFRFENEPRPNLMFGIRVGPFSLAVWENLWMRK